MIGTLDDLEGILMRHVIDDVLITLPIKSCYGKIQNTIALCERLGVRAAYLADVFQSSLGRPSYEQTGPFPGRADARGDRRSPHAREARDGSVGGAVGLMRGGARRDAGRRWSRSSCPGRAPSSSASSASG